MPVVASAAIWLITGSLFALIFAALGPLAATGSYIDSRVTARKTLKTEARRFAADVSATEDAINAYQRRESSDLAELTPPAIELVYQADIDSARWMRQPREVLPVHLGYGRVRSNLSLDGAGTPDRVNPATEEQYERLLNRAANLQDAPIAVNARLGIAIFGNKLIALSLGRALAIQLARTLSPTTSWVRPRGLFSEEQWSSCLPHRVLRSDGRAQDGLSAHEVASVHWGQLEEDEPSVSITVVEREQQVPSGHRIVIRASGEAVVVIGHPDKHQRREFRPSFLGSEQALVWALAAHTIAARDGLSTNAESVPESLEFQELLKQLDSSTEPLPRRARSLESCPAVGANGRVVVDLVANGPHAIVGGTTGSGKSELLISWVLAMAAESSPDEVTFLLVDFKGGSAFAHLAQLPHTVGIITDLDETAAGRAFASLRAELRYRERTLADAGARDISEIESLPRLVIVVDEFAAMMGDYPQLHALFSDIAARGRSLGVHLILCTQRPSGVVRDALLANADLRVSLRVNNGADSSAVIGSDRAAELPAQVKGRAWLAHGSSSAELVQFALATPHDVASVAERWPTAFHPRRPWCEPLAERILLGDLAELITEHSSTAVHFGMTDLPDQQKQGLAGWSPLTDGNMLILGAPGSGKSTTIATIAAAVHFSGDTVLGAIQESTATPLIEGIRLHVVAGGVEPAAFWDIISELHSRLDNVGRQQDDPQWILLTIDDLDAAISRFDDDYRAAIVDKLTRLLREGPPEHIWVVATAQRITPALQSLAQLIPSTLRLRFGSRQDYVLSGGVSADYEATLPPGGGQWKGTRVQIARSETYPPLPRPAAATTIARTDSLVVASSRPASAASALAAAGWHVRTLDGAPGAERELLVTDTHRPVALVGSVDEWQSRWGSLAMLKTHATVLLDGCSLSDYRQLARSRELPPPLTVGAGHYWRVTEGAADRVSLPTPQ